MRCIFAVSSRMVSQDIFYSVCKGNSNEFIVYEPGLADPYGYCQEGATAAIPQGIHVLEGFGVVKPYVLGPQKLLPFNDLPCLFDYGAGVPCSLSRRAHGGLKGFWDCGGGPPLLRAQVRVPGAHG